MLILFSLPIFASLVSNLLAIVAGFVIIFFGNYLFYGVLAAGFFESHMGSATGVQKEEVSMAFIALGCLVQAYVLATLYSKWANGTVTSMVSEHLSARQHRLIADAMDELEKEDD